MVGEKIFIAMAAGYWPECSWRGAEGAIFGAPPLLRSGGGAIDEPSGTPRMYARTRSQPEA